MKQKKKELLDKAKQIDEKLDQARISYNEALEQEDYERSVNKSIENSGRKF